MADDSYSDWFGRGVRASAGIGTADTAARLYKAAKRRVDRRGVDRAASAVKDVATTVGDAVPAAGLPMGVVRRGMSALQSDPATEAPGHTPVDASKSEEAVTSKVPMAQLLSTPVRGGYVGGSPGGHRFTPYGASGFEDIGVSPSGRQNIHRSLSADANIGEAKARLVEQKAASEADMMQYAARLREHSGKFESQVMRESEMRRRQLDDMARKMQDTMAQVDRDFNTPDKLFDPRTGGAKGVLGVFAALMWSLSSPEYQRNTLGVANSLATQDYRNKMLRRQKLGQRAGMLNDALSYYERAYGRSVQAAEAYRAHLKNYMADQMEAMAMRSSSEAIRQRAPIVAAEIRNQGFKNAINTLSKFYTPPRRGAYQAAIKLNKEGKPIGVMRVGPDGRLHAGQVIDDTRILVHTFGGKQVPFVTSGKEEASKLRGTLAALASGKAQMSRAAQLVKDAMNEPNRSAQLEMFEEAEQLAVRAKGMYSQAAASGVLQKYELGDANRIMTEDVGGFATFTGQLKKAATTLGRRITMEDMREPERRSIKKLEGLVSISNQLEYDLLNNLPIAQRVHEPAPGGGIAASAWVPSQEHVSGPARLSTEYPSEIVHPGADGGKGGK